MTTPTAPAGRVLHSIEDELRALVEELDCIWSCRPSKEEKRGIAKALTPAPVIRKVVAPTKVIDKDRVVIGKLGRQFKKDALSDSHVRLYLKSFSPTERALWVCPKCAKQTQGRFRSRCLGGRLKNHCGCRNYVFKGESWDYYKSPKRIKAQIEYKRALRLRKAEAEGRPFVVRHTRKSDAHAKALLQEEIRIRKQKRREDKLSNYRQKNIDQNRKHVDTLSNTYVSKRLKKNMPCLVGVKLPQSLIDLERVRLSITREIRRMKK